MIAIIPAAGKGVRLKPLTAIAPKPLLPVYNKPMIFYPLLSLKEASLTDVVFVINQENKKDFKDFFKDGKDLGFNFKYVVQKERLGIAHAIYQAKKFAQGQKIIVIHSDNVFEKSLKPAIKDFQNQSFNIDNQEVTGCRLVLKKVKDPKRFGVAEIKGGLVVDIQEKPAKPKSHWITTGCWMFDERAFDFIDKLPPSQRTGELEISELANMYVKEKTASYTKLQKTWFDVGTIDALQEASNFIAQNKKLREWKLYI